MDHYMYIRVEKVVHSTSPFHVYITTKSKRGMDNETIVSTRPWLPLCFQGVHRKC